MLRALVCAALCASLYACRGGASTPSGSGLHAPTSSEASEVKSAAWPDLVTQLEMAGFAGETEEQGESDGSSVPMVRAAMEARSLAWTRVPLPRGAHPLITDIAWFQGAIWVSLATKTISLDGAQIYSYHPDRGWKLELDWDRGGAPGVTHEVGGQGIARLRVIDDRLYATDADAPNLGGFGISAAPLEGYVFVAGPKGFGALQPGLLPPAQTLMVPLAFHVFDITRFGGRLLVSGGTLSPPGSSSRFPGGLFVQEKEQELWPRFFPGMDTKAGVVRATFMHRFNGRLYVGFQNNERRMQWDIGVLDGDPLAPNAALVLGRVTKEGGWKTRHFASDSQRLYWLASNHQVRDRTQIFESRDGLQFDAVSLPSTAGEPHDALALEGGLIVLSDKGLYRRSSYELPLELVLAAPPDAPFARRDSFCSAAMTATPLGLVAGSTGGQGLFIATSVARE